MKLLRYSNTNTYYIDGLLVDTGYAGNINGLFREMKRSDIRIGDISCLFMTHYHPDHAGLAGELMKMGINLLLIDIQKEHVHFQDRIFERDGISYVPVDESRATVISCEESRGFLMEMGISGEMVSTPSHSPDSVSLILDSGECFVGDVEPFEYIEIYGNNDKLMRDWEKILSFHPKTVYYSHVNSKITAG